MGRRALIVGINEYNDVSSLNGCVNDALEVKRVLERHNHNEDEEKNFDVELITTESHNISKTSLKDRIEELFRDNRDISILYFSGHGYIENTGGYLVTSECKRGDEGLSMNDVLVMANASPAQNRIIILDCCHAGGFGKDTLNRNVTIIGEGVTVLAASAENQYSVEKNGSGVFTNLLIHALEGGAANVLGEISAGNIYGYIDKAMGETGQRPMFITNVRRYAVLRRVYTQIKTSEIRQLTDFFHDSPDMAYKLDPSYEPTSKKSKDENTEKFAMLQKFNSVNLVIPVDAEHMYYAAMKSKTCKLTSLGKSYWVMVNNNII
ncbi:caspase family protein [Psychroserpens sp.]